ncbi:MAG: BtpA/SgcQ family protein [Desulfurococcaceae archaeon]
MKIIGVIHLPPLPGSPGYNGLKTSDYVNYVLNETEKVLKAGLNGVIIENYMDYPYSVRLTNIEALNVLEKVVYSVKEEYSDLIVGVNVLRNSSIESVEIACRTGIDFIRINAYYEPLFTPEGYLKPVARLVWNKIRERNCCVKIYADVNVKHSRKIFDFIEALYNTCLRGRVHGAIITGIATGFETPVHKVFIAKNICRDREIWVGSGVSINNIGKYVGLADGVIVGTSIKENGLTSNPIDYVKALKLVEKARKYERIVSKQIGLMKSVGGSINSLHMH